MYSTKSIGDVVRNLVGVLGFRPVESLVVAAVQGGCVSCVLRVDLSDVAASNALERLASLVGRSGADGALAVFVSTPSSSCEMCAERFAGMAARLGEALEAAGVRLLDAVMLDRVEAGGRWQCVDRCGKSGVLDDPASSAAAAAAVVAGRRMYETRDELRAIVAVDVQRAAAVAPMLDGAGGAVDDVPVSVRQAVAAVRRVGQGAVLSNAELADIGASLGDVRVRDALFTLVDSHEASAAEMLWSQLARVLPQPYRSEALCLVGFSAFSRGEGPLAGVALEAALADDPAHRMAGLLDCALQNGVRPEEIRNLIQHHVSALVI
ncbi:MULTISPECIES: DUF4192 domain-containing protein [Mycobacterium avium complex (MAC)]|uniref:DUF4192 domain-containing protein n=1 Tax=Mycobacterium colombiense TaxID=339268 RepID=A0A329LLJ4_9MYCO|nr:MULTISPECIES: DUF4192 domain-containing protein [Mycobacterium avium complex (MAC)]OBG15018.1 hypothetical protein A5769_17840 [Mycobacterium intracellulare]RAV08821.1 DUF4192 domain-containing protein [Mycobacterium colombiense]